MSHYEKVFVSIAVAEDMRLPPSFPAYEVIEALCEPDFFLRETDSGLFIVAHRHSGYKLFAWPHSLDTAKRLVEELKKTPIDWSNPSVGYLVAQKDALKETNPAALRDVFTEAFLHRGN